LNIALSSILILLIVLPGILARYTYKKGIWKSPAILNSYTNELISGISISVLLNIILLWIIELVGYEVDFDIVFSILSGNYSVDGYEYILRKIEKSYYVILFYFAFSHVFGVAIGLGLHCIVRKLRLDVKFPIIRFNNYWYYILSGENWIIDEIQSLSTIKRFKIPNKNIDQIINSIYVVASAVVTQGTDTYLYWGTVDNYQYNKLGELSTIELRGAFRRRLQDDSKTNCSEIDPEKDQRYYKIFGNSLIIDYSDIKTLNIEYRYIEEE
jgi:hypothetical protein